MNLSAKDLEKKIDKAYKILEQCTLCPRKCNVNRTKGERGYCGVGQAIEVASYGPHFGEEEVLVGRYGSGAIFLNSCNLSCVYCQNYDISQLRSGMAVSVDEFVQIMLLLQKKGCHNINFVTPTHFMPQILEAVFMAKEKGLKIPLVYNCGGYESLESLKILRGVIDIYMPDIKYADEDIAARLSNVAEYPKIARQAIKEMHNQVGDLEIDANGIARKGLLLRHLVLPDDLSGTEQNMRFIATEISPESYVNIMDQYRPCFKASDIPQLNRPLTQEEYIRALNIAQSLGLHRGFWPPEN
ncbi:MAG: radical SAM protein [Candidatus Omnitrophica bacterium]|nr:radical SAM protein [Candidatus Omnitrophota bacterium]